MSGTYHHYYYYDFWQIYQFATVVLCADSAAHKSEIQLTLEANSGLLQTNPSKDIQYSFKLKTVLDSVHHPEEGDGS